MKNKRAIFTLILLFFVLVFSVGQTVKAVSSDNGKADYTVNSGKRKQFDYTTHNLDYGVTVKSGSSPSQQMVNAFTQVQTENSKVVTWAKNTNYGTTFANVLEIAKDYEAKHPEWKVVGGTNADQYYQKAGTDGTVSGADYFYPQPYYPMICDGESWFSITVTPYGAQNVAGFLQGGLDDPIISGSANWNGGSFKLAGLFLSIVDEEGNVINKFAVDKFNSDPEDGQIAVYSPYIQGVGVAPTSMNINRSNLFTVESAELAYVSNSRTYTYKSVKENAQDAFFGKGAISSKNENVTLNRGQFAISTNKQEVLDLLDIGVNVKVQYEYEGLLGEVESAIGYHTIQRMDDKDRASNAAYNTRAYSRSLFGRTKDGKIVLITVDMTTGVYVGTSHDETNAILKYYGCVEAYQMDGGGSVQAISRNSNDELAFVSNVVSGARRVHSALLLVERRMPEFDISVESIFDTSITLKITNLKDYGRIYNNIYLVFNDEVHEIVDGIVQIDNLRANKEYSYSLQIDDDYGKGYRVLMDNIKTLLARPTITNCELEVNGDNYIFKPTFKDRNNSIKSFYIEIGDNKYQAVDSVITIPNMDLKAISKLVVIYDIGNGDYILELIYPHSLVLRKANSLFDEQNKIIKQAGLFN